MNSTTRDRIDHATREALQALRAPVEPEQVLIDEIRDRVEQSPAFELLAGESPDAAASALEAFARQRASELIAAGKAAAGLRDP